jgi:hypothetical protein
VIESLTHWPWWVYFLIGYVFGFMMASWTIGWHAKETEKDRERLQNAVNMLSRQLRAYQIASIKSVTPSDDYD